MFSFFKSKSSRKDEDLRNDLRKILGVRPKNIGLYKTAMVHRSVSRSLPKGTSDNNERLEYLGDAIISAAVAEYLYRQYPCKREGFLSQMRSKLVSRKTLNLIAESTGISKHIVARQGVNLTDNKNLFGNTIEALMGALFLDQGFDCTKHIFIERLLMKYVSLEQLEFEEIDYKSRLIEWGQKRKQPVTFNSVEERTKATLPKKFVAIVTANNEQIGKGQGSSKKEAEQEAAHSAWEHISAGLMQEAS